MSSTETNPARSVPELHWQHAPVILPDDLKIDLAVLEQNIVDIINRQATLDDVRTYAWVYLNAITKLITHLDTHSSGCLSPGLRYYLDELNSFFVNSEKTEEQFHASPPFVKTAVAIFLADYDSLCKKRAHDENASVCASVVTPEQMGIYVKS